MKTKTAAGIQSFLDAIVSNAKNIENDLTKPLTELPDDLTVARLAMSVRDFILLLQNDDPVRWNEIETPFTAILSAVKVIESNLPIARIGKQICELGLTDDVGARDSLKALALVSMSAARLIQEIANQIVDPRTQLWFADLDDEPEKTEDKDSGSQE